VAEESHGVDLPVQTKKHAVHEGLWLMWLVLGGIVLLLLSDNIRCFYSYDFCSFVVVMAVVVYFTLMS